MENKQGLSMIKGDTKDTSITSHMNVLALRKDFVGDILKVKSFLIIH